MATTESLLLEIQKPDVFSAFIQAGMRENSIEIEWLREMGTPEYSASKAYQTYLAEYSAVMAGSVIDKNAEKPTHTLPVASELVGTIGRMGDEWQLDNDKLSQFYYMEQRYRDSFVRNYVGVNSDEQRAELVNYLFGMFQEAVIAPHKRIDMLYFEGLFNGTQTLSPQNNLVGNINNVYDLGVKKFKAKVAKWGEKTSTPISDLQDVCDFANSQGKNVKRIRMSRATFRKMCMSDEIVGRFEMKMGKANVTPITAISLDSVNSYLESVMLPTIQVEAPRFITTPGRDKVKPTTIPMIPEDRVTFMCEDRVAVLKVSDPLEAIDQIPNKSYSTYEGNLVGFWRSDKGRFVDYEMWATPVFNGKNSFYILETDKTA
ncbi:MAG: hypothetical protein UIG52_00695 [Bacteroidales bacterium]|nr:hypothetical protein [Bacteroidales bacterium]